MDVLRPPIMRIGGRCYRKNGAAASQRHPFEEDEEDYNEPDDRYEDDRDEEEEEDADYVIEQTSSGWSIAMDIPTEYFKYIIGKKAETKRRLENETKTQIQIPRQGQDGRVVIVSHDKKGVQSAMRRINIMVESARQKQPFTHFLSFPINSSHIKQAFLEFKDDVLRFCDGDRGLDASIFQKPEKLHMTLGTLALLNDREITQATDLLHKCQHDLVRPILAGTPLKAQVRGLEYMNDDPNAVDVLYAKVHLHDESDRLQLLSDRLVERFSSAGLMQRDYDRVKLHITVMNTLMRRDPSGTSEPRRGDTASSRGGRMAGHQPPGGGGGRERESFDAGNVLKNYRDYDFGAYHIDTLHLSQRYSAGQDGYYACASHLQLP